MMCITSLDNLPRTNPPGRSLMDVVPALLFTGTQDTSGKTVVAPRPFAIAATAPAKQAKPSTTQGTNRFRINTESSVSGGNKPKGRRPKPKQPRLPTTGLNI